MGKKYRRNLWTELYLSAHVATGLAIIFLSSKIQNAVQFKEFFSETFDLLFTITSFCLAGVLTFFIRRSALTCKKETCLDANIMTRVDLLTIGQAASIFILGMLPLILPPISENLLQYFSLATLVSVVSLNTYFSNFWMEKSIVFKANVNLDALKLEHGDWENIFKSVSLIFLIPIGGVVYKYLIEHGEGQQGWQLYFNGISILYNVLGAPIFWLMRPMYIQNVVTRNKIARLTIK